MARDTPPRDSWIPIKAGQKIAFDIASVKEQQQSVARLGREVRGAVLASAFEVEYIVDQLILQALLPESPSLKAVREVFDDTLLKRGPLRFANKVRLLKAFHRAIPTLGAALPIEVLTDIDKIRNLRNDFAHYPIALHPKGPEPIRELTAVLCGAEGDTTLDEAGVQSIYLLLRVVTEQLNEALRKLNGETAAV